MERLTEYDYEQVMLKGLNIVGIGEQNADILVDGISKLADYEDTGLTPEEIKEDIRVHTDMWKEKLKEVQAERDQWHKEAITYADQLGMLRIWHSKYGPSVEEILEEDFKTMFPDTKCSRSDSN